MSTIGIFYYIKIVKFLQKMSTRGGQEVKKGQILVNLVFG